jgi:inhibitor of KinA sporulation pathway (predicted exonuclease)
LQRGGKALSMTLALGFIWVFGAEVLKHLEGNVNDHYSELVRPSSPPSLTSSVPSTSPSPTGPP